MIASESENTKYRFFSILHRSKWKLPFSVLFCFWPAILPPILSHQVIGASFVIKYWRKLTLLPDWRPNQCKRFCFYRNWDSSSLPSPCDRPRVIESLRGVEVVDIAAGGAHSACITASGELYTWGKGRYGRLGHGDSEDQLKPKLVCLFSISVSLAVLQLLRAER